MKETLIFHHIPKTAGSTFNSVLAKMYSKENTFAIDGLEPAKSWNEFNSLDESVRNSFSLIYGHLSDKFEKRISCKTKKIVFLRDPIDHAVSSFYYIKRAEWNKHNDAVNDMNSIEEFLKYRTANNLDNIQLRHVSGSTGFLLEGKTDDEVVANENMLKKGINVLNSTDFVLLTEFFDESLVILFDQLSWSNWPSYKTHNKTKKRPFVEDYSKEQINMIKQYNGYDIKLYNHAKMLFKRKLSEIDSPHFKRNLKWFKVYNALKGFIKI